MPVGGIKWRKELEKELKPKEFKKVTSEIQVLGIDDAPFAKKDKDVKIVAVLTRGAKMMDGVFHSSIKKDGLDATDRIIQLVKDIKRENARAILLDGITYGGFNTVDIERVWKGTGIPVIVSMDKHPDHEAIHKALRNLPDSDLRKGMIKSAGMIHGVRLGDKKVFIQVAGINEKDAEEIIKTTTINGLVPEPLRAAHMIAKGAYTEIPKEEKDEEWLHVKAYNYVRHTHKKVKRMKHVYFPGISGEIVSFLIALLLAWLFIQGLGWALGTASPLVVVESESMIHQEGWQGWHFNNNLNPDTYGFQGGMNIGDIILVKGDNTDDITIGDIVVYTKYGPTSIGGEPIIHRIVGIVDVSGNSVNTQGAVTAVDGGFSTPCSKDSRYGLNEIRNIYSTETFSKLYPDIDLDDFRLFLTKGDNNQIEDQCKVAGLISYPIHEDLISGRAKLDIPYLGYVKLGLVCAFNYATGNSCNCRCWWPATHPKCCA
jgi:hypothetical protein